MVEAAGIAFIGPSSHPMNLLGDKINSKKIAKDANCFVIPGFEGEVETEDRAVELAREVGYPVMIKASAGGGGKGMRVAYNDDEVREGFRISKAEALSSFGDDRMLIERFIENPHHIEIQVLADTHGNVVAFPERECSVQRRNQKVVEESPSVYLSPETRRAMQLQAIALCKAVNYRSAGTIEMLADDKQNFFFLEMNTRLQVEHPITELVSGEDLVEHMLWIASGKPLPERLTKVQCLPYNGSAIECRVYAEDPTRNFLPSIGPLINYKEPKTYASNKGTVRIDTGVFEGGIISMHYDPMISKLCTWAPNRKDSIALMEDALDNYVIQGLGNNLTFLRSIMRNSNFRKGNYCTKFIPEEYPNGFKMVDLTPFETQQMIASAVALHLAENEHLLTQVPSHHEAHNRINEVIAHNSHEEYPDIQYNRSIAVLGGPKGDAYEVEIRITDKLMATVTPLDEHRHPIVSKRVEVAINQMDWEPGQSLAHVHFMDEKKKQEEKFSTVQYLQRTAEGLLLRFRGCEQEIIVRTPKEHDMHRHMLKPEVKDTSKFLMCPMPGTLISCSVKEGQVVEVGQQVCVVEAMKMQNVLRAERKQTVKKIRKQPGNALKVDEVIIEFEE